MMLFSGWSAWNSFMIPRQQTEEKSGNPCRWWAVWSIHPWLKVFGVGEIFSSMISCRLFAFMFFWCCIDWNVMVLVQRISNSEPIYFIMLFWYSYPISFFFFFLASFRRPNTTKVVNHLDLAPGGPWDKLREVGMETVRKTQWKASQGTTVSVMASATTIALAAEWFFGGSKGHHA